MCLSDAKENFKTQLHRVILYMGAGVYQITIWLDAVTTQPLLKQ